MAGYKQQSTIDEVKMADGWLLGYAQVGSSVNFDLVRSLTADVENLNPETEDRQYTYQSSPISVLKQYKPTMDYDTPRATSGQDRFNDKILTVHMDRETLDTNRTLKLLRVNPDEEGTELNSFLGYVADWVANPSTTGGEASGSKRMTGTLNEVPDSRIKGSVIWDESTPGAERWEFTADSES